MGELDFLEAIAKNTKATCIQLRVIQATLLPIAAASLKYLGFF